jgi:hypothetical protein
METSEGAKWNTSEQNGTLFEEWRSVSRTRKSLGRWALGRISGGGTELEVFRFQGDEFNSYQLKL